MKILFLDIDGVVCTYRAHWANGAKGSVMTKWDVESCKLIAFLCKKYSFKIVISSTWRLQKHRPLLMRRLREYGLSEFLAPISMRYTPELNSVPTSFLFQWRDSSSREIEIMAWLKKWEERAGVKKYFVLDDARCAIFGSAWVKTEMYDGFGATHFKYIRDIVDNK